MGDALDLTKLAEIAIKGFNRPVGGAGATTTAATEAAKQPLSNVQLSQGVGTAGGPLSGPGIGNLPRSPTFGELSNQQLAAAGGTAAGVGLLGVPGEASSLQAGQQQAAAVNAAKGPKEQAFTKKEFAKQAASTAITAGAGALLKPGVSTPAPPQAPAQPDTLAAQRRRELLRRARAGKGVGSTILTSPLGVQNRGNVAVKTLTGQ